MIRAFVSQLKFSYCIIAVFIVAATHAQVKIQTNPEEPPMNVGGKAQFDHVVRTQLYIAPTYIWKEEKNVTIFFTVTKEGKVLDPFFKGKHEVFFENECKRMLNYFQFEPAKIGGAAVDAYGSLTFNFNGPKYDESIKERKKLKKLLTKPQDSTFTIYEIADKSPEFYKGDEELPAFILENIEYPNVAKMQNIEGTVQLSFIIEANGYVSNVKAVKTVNGGCTEEAIRVALLLKWKPAEKNGKYVRYKVTYPITFNLKNVNKDNSSSGQ